MPVAILPNPFSRVFTLTKLYSEKATVSVYDALGRLLEQKMLNEGELSVVLGGTLATGSNIV